MERYLANRESKRRGWYSYTELNILLCYKDFAFIKDFLSVRRTLHLLFKIFGLYLILIAFLFFQCYFMCCLSYVASVLSMIGLGLLTIQMKDIIIDNISFDTLNYESALSPSSCSSVPATYNVINDQRVNLLGNDSEVSDDVSLESHDLCNSELFDSENSCDNSSFACCFSNVSSERFFLTIKLPSTHREILRMLYQSKKSNIIKKKSLVFTKFA